MAKVLGISCYYHDSAAALLHDGRIAAAAEEERFSRLKHDTSFPFHAIEFCLGQGRTLLEEVDAVAFYEKPFVKFQRVLQTHARWFPRSLPAFLATIPDWLGRKLLVPYLLRNHLGYDGPVHFIDHHTAHGASAYRFAPFDEAAVLTVDGTGEWATTTLARGSGGRLEPLAEIRYPHSLGLLYSAVTAYLGFPVNEGEGRVMGLAAYGEPDYLEQFDNLIRFDGNGGFQLDMDWFSFPRSTRRMHTRRWAGLFGPPREPGSPLEDRHRALAATVQLVLEKGMIGLAGEAARRAGTSKALALAGGVALNCVANGRLLRQTPFREIFIQPAAGDSGAALGAAAEVHRALFPGIPVQPMTTSLLGPAYDQKEIANHLSYRGMAFEELPEEELTARTADHLAANRIVGWFQGRMEFGPRALGARSILANPGLATMKDTLNRRVKGREPFRPFAPSVMEEHCADCFDLDRPSPFMLLAAGVRPEWKERIPAVVHEDGTARIQTVNRERDPLYHRLLADFRERTGIPLLLNTSFNLMGEPIVCTPAQAVDCFNRADMDVLVLGRCMVTKNGRGSLG